MEINKNQLYKLLKGKYEDRLIAIEFLKALGVKKIPEYLKPFKNNLSPNDMGYCQATYRIKCTKDKSFKETVEYTYSIGKTYYIQITHDHIYVDHINMVKIRVRNGSSKINLKN